jgi:hypothetical protein
VKTRNILLIVVMCAVTATLFGQSARFAGKWGTDGAATGAASSMILNLRVDARSNVTGSMTQYAIARCGAPNTTLQINSGTVAGNAVTFTTVIPPCPAAGTANAPREPGTQVTWTGILGNDDSLSISGVASGVSAARGASGAAPVGDSSRASGSRNPLGTPSNPLARGGDIAAPGAGTGGTTGTGATLNFPSSIMHRM